MACPRPFAAGLTAWVTSAANSFPLVFADPPYDLKNIKTIPKEVFDNNWVAQGGLLVIEHGKETDFSKEPHYQYTRTYSRVNFSFFAIEEMTVVE